MNFANDAAPEKHPRPRQLDALEPEQLISVIMLLAMELNVTRERLATHEALLIEAGILTREKIDEFTPGERDAERRADDRNALVAAIIDRLRPAP